MDLILASLVGILLGGLLNCLADDLPDGNWPRLPRYADGSRRPLISWLGVTDWLTRSWRREADGPRLRRRYPVCELCLAALLALMQAVAGADATVPAGRLLIWHACTVLFVLLAVVDIERKQILTEPLWALLGLALLDAALHGQAAGLASALAGGACGIAVFGALYLGGIVYARAAGSLETALGWGDALVMGAAGAILGFPNVVIAMALAIAFGGGGAVVYLAALRIQGRKYQRFTALAYAPYILAGTYITLLFQGEMSRIALGLAG